MRMIVLMWPVVIDSNLERKSNSSRELCGREVKQARSIMPCLACPLPPPAPTTARGKTVQDVIWWSFCLHGLLNLTLHRRPCACLCPCPYQLPYHRHYFRTRHPRRHSHHHCRFRGQTDAGVACLSDVESGCMPRDDVKRAVRQRAERGCMLRIKLGGARGV